MNGLIGAGKQRGSGSGGVQSVNGQTGAVTGAQAVAGADISPASLTSTGAFALTAGGALTKFGYLGRSFQAFGYTVIEADLGVTGSLFTGGGIRLGTNAVNGGVDASISRTGPGSIAFGNGTSGDASGHCQASTFGDSGRGGYGSFELGSSFLKLFYTGGVRWTGGYANAPTTTALIQATPGTLRILTGDDAAGQQGNLSLGTLTASAPGLPCGEYTLSGLPSAAAATGRYTAVSNPAAGKSYSVRSDGTNWRYTADQSIAA